MTAVDDLVRSVGRIKTMQDGSPRHIEFGMARVVDVGDLITVNPVGKNAILLCRPEDLEVVEEASHELEQTPASKASGEQIAEENKPDAAIPEPEPEFQPGGIVPPTGTIAVSGTAEQPPSAATHALVGKVKPKPKAKPRTLKEKREQEDKADDNDVPEPAPKPKPRRRRR